MVSKGLLGWVAICREAAQVQALQPADLDEASRSSMNQRCSNVALPGMSRRKSLAPTSKAQGATEPMLGNPVL